MPVLSLYRADLVSNGKNGTIGTGRGVMFAGWSSGAASPGKWTPPREAAGTETKPRGPI